MDLGGGSVSYGSLVVMPGGTLSITDNETITGSIDNQGTITIANGKALTISSALFNEDGGTINGNVVDNALMDFLDNTTNAAVSGAISGSGIVAQDGTANLTLSGPNSFTGGVEVDSGTVTMGNASALGSSTASSVTINNSATLNLNNYVLVANAITINSGVIDLDTGGIVVPLANFSFTPAACEDDEYLDNGLGMPETGNDAIHDALQEGANFATGYWNGTNGIISSAAETDSTYSTAVGDASDAYLGYNTWRGATVSHATGSVSLIISYTYYGDANLDGVVNLDDYNLWATSHAEGYGSATGSTHCEWIDGDWDGMEPARSTISICM